MSGSGRIHIRLVLRIIERVQRAPAASLAQDLHALRCSRATLYRQIAAARDELGVEIEYREAGVSEIRSWGILNPAKIASRR
jgi:hypothetical protein